MRRCPVSILLALLLCNVTSCVREDFGIAAANPLGDSATIVEIFAEKGLQKTSHACDLREIDGKIPADDSEAIPGRFDLFVDDKRANDKQTAKLYYSEDDRLVAVRIDFRSDERGYDKGYYKLGRFLFDYWNRLGGEGRAFAQARGDVRIMGKEALEANFESNFVRGRWVKQIFDGNLRDRVQDLVLIRRR